VLTSPGDYSFAYNNGSIVSGNQNVPSSYAYSKLLFEMPFNGSLVVSVRQSSEAGYDYGILS
jgi:hypothetical protein